MERLSVDNRANGSRQEGFTLVEMMVVVAIMGIILAIAAPSMGELMRSQRLRSSVSALQSALMFARSEAIKRNGTVTITRAGGGWSSGWSITAGATTLKVQDALADTTASLSVGGTDTAAISYVSSGRLALATGSPQFTLYVTSNPARKARCISVNLTGMPSTKDDSDDNKANGC